MHWFNKGKIKIDFYFVTDKIYHELLSALFNWNLATEPSPEELAQPLSILLTQIPPLRMYK